MSRTAPSPLGPLVRIRTGKLDANANNPSGQYPFFTCSKTPLRISSYSFDCECVLVAGNGDLNVKYYQGKFDAYQRTYIIESLDSKVLSPKYLFHFLSEYVDELRRGSVGGVIKFIKLGHLTEALISVPPLAEQERIVKLLDEADELRKLRAQADRRTAALIPALFHEMFGAPSSNPKGWQTKPLGEVLELSRERVEPTDYPDKSFNYVGLESIEGHSGKLLPYQPTLGAEIKSTKNVFHPGEILYGKLRPYLNKVYLANTEGICSTDIYVLRPRQRQVHPSFAETYLRSPPVLTVVSNAMAGANLPRIGQESLLAILTPVPPLPLQQEFAQRISEIRELQAVQAASRQRVEHLFQSMLHRAFNQEL